MKFWKKFTGRKPTGSAVPSKEITDGTDRSFLAETLEARILFSAAPVEAPPEPQVEQIEPAEEQEAPQTSGFEPIEQFVVSASQVEPPRALITENDLQPLFAEAITRWMQTGLSEAQATALGQVSFEIVQLEGNLLGYAEGSRIFIDADAAGRGWFLDATPWDDVEFIGSTAGTIQGIDLLSVTAHELGHLLGLGESSHTASVMYDLFLSGERRMPVWGEAAGAMPFSLEGPHFSHTGLTQVTIADQAEWDTAVPSLTSGHEVVFSGAGGTINVTGTVTVGALHFSTGNYTLSGGTISLAGTGGSIEVNAGVTGTISSVIGGTVGLTKTGEGTLTLSGANTYSGATTINNGELRSGASHVIPNGSAVTVNHNIVSTSALLNLNGFDDTIGTLTFGGTGGLATSVNQVTTGTGTLTLGGNLTVSAIGTWTSTPILSGNLDLGGATRTFTVNDSTGAAVDLDIQARISGNGDLIKAGTGTLSLSNNGNSFTGALSINAGTVSITSIAASGSNSAAGAGNQINIGSGTTTAGILTYTGSGDSTNRTINLAATTTGGATINHNGASGALVFTGTVLNPGTGAKTLTLGGTNTAANDFQSAIGNGSGGGSIALVKTGTGNWTLSNNTNSFTGALSINQGTLTLTSIADSGTNSAAGAGSQINIGSGTTTAGILTYTGSGDSTNRTINLAATTTGGATINHNGASGALVFTGTVLNPGTGAKTLTLGGTNTAANDFQSAIGNGSGTIAVAKAGNGIWTLSGNNSFTGNVTLTAGTLNLGHANSLGAGTGTMTLTAGTINNTSGAAITLPNRTISVGGNITFGGNSIHLGNGTVTLTDSRTFTNNLSSGQTLTIGGTVVINNSGTRTFTVTGTGATAIQGAINDGTATTALTKAGTGTLTLSGASGYTGGTTHSAGVLNLNNASAIGTGTLTVSAAATIDNTSGSALTLSTNNAIALNNNLTFTGTNDLNLGTGAVTMTAGRTVTSSTAGRTLTFGGAINYNNATTAGTLTITGAGNVILGGVVDETNTANLSLTKSGEGFLTLSGTNAYAGTTTLSAGTLNINSSTAIGNGALTLTSGTIDNTSGSAVSLSTSNAIALNGNIIFTGTNDLNLGTGAVTMTAGRTVTSSTAGRTLTFGGTVNYNNATTAGTLTITGAGDVAISGIIDEINTANLSLTKSGTGVLTLSGANAYAGTTTINNGELRSGAANVLPDSTNVTVNQTVTAAGTAARLNLNGFSDTIGTLTFGGTGGQAGSVNQVTTGAGTLTLGGNLTVTATGNWTTPALLSGNLDLGAANRTFTVNNSTGTDVDLDVQATISGSVSLTKTGAGTLLLSAANPYTGATTINNGTLRYGIDAAIHASSAVTVNPNAAGLTAILDLDGKNGTVASLTIGGTGQTATSVAIVQTGAGTLTLNGDLTTVATGNPTTAPVISGNLNLGSADRVFTVNNGTGTDVDLDLQANISGGGGVIKAGLGNLQVAGANTYAGATNINAGTLLVNGSHSGGGAYTVAAGATLGGTGSTASVVTVSAGGAINPGLSTGDVTDSLGSGNLALTSGSNFAVQLESLTEFDQVVVTGAVTLGGATLDLTLTPGYNPAANESFVLIANDGSDTVSGTFNGLPEGASFTVGGTVFTITYAGGTNNNDVVLTAISSLTTVYVDSAWAALNRGDAIADADAGTSGNQAATFKINAFATIAEAIAAVGLGGTIIVNGGIYAESVNLDNDKTLVITGPDSGDTVTINALSTAVGTTLRLEGTSTLVFGHTTNTTVAGLITGSGNLTYTGGSATSTVTITGDNDYTGITTINRGTVAIQHSNALGATGPNSKTVINGADGAANNTRLLINTNNSLNIAETFELKANAAGRVTVETNSSATHAFSGPIDVTSATNFVQFSSNGTGAMTVTGDITGTLTSGSILYVRGASTNTANHIQGSLNISGGLNKTDAGLWVVGAAGKSYSWSSTAVNNGELRSGADDVLPDTANFTVNRDGVGTARLNLDGFSDAIGSLTFGGTNGNAGSINQVTTGTGTLTLGGNITVSATGNWTNPALLSGNLNLGNANRTFTVNDSTGSAIDLNITANISGGLGLTKAGAGTLQLSGSNTYSGTTTINAGVVNLDGGNAIADTGAVNLANTAGVVLNLLANETIGSLAGGGSTGGNITLGGNTLTVGADNTDAIYSGVISGSGGLTKIGAGTQTLAGNNTYGGTTEVNSGTLLITGSPTGNGAYSVASGATLGGNGAPSAAATLGSGHFTLPNGAIFTPQLDSAAIFDKINVTGTVTLGGTLLLGGAQGFTATEGTSFLLIDNDGSDPVSGTFSGLAQGATLTAGGVVFTISYTGGDGNDVEVTATAATVSTVYVDAGWSALAPGAAIVDADAGSSGNQAATFKFNAFATLAEAIAAVGTGGTIIVNGGSYAETVTLDNDKTLRITGANQLQLVAISSLSSAAGTNIILEGDSNLTLGNAGNQSIAGVISGNGSLTKTGSGILTLSGANTYSGGTTIHPNSGTVVATVSTTQNSIGTGEVAIGAGSLLQLNNTNTSGTSVTINNSFTGAGTLRLNFAAGTTARNTFMQNVTGLTGVIQLSNAGSNADKYNVSGFTTSASLVIDSGSQLMSASGTTTFNGGITVQGTGNSETRGAIRLIGTVGGDITLAGNTSIGTEGGTLTGNITSGASGTQILTLGTTSSTGNATLSGVIGGGVGAIALTKTAAGTVTLTGVNTYTGITTISAGSLQISSDSNLGASPSSFSAAQLTLNGGTLLTSASFAIDSNRGITLNAGTQSAINTSSGTTLTGNTVISGGGALTKSGAGTLVLSTDNTYAGATNVSAGTLMVTSANALGSTAGGTYVASGASLFFDAAGGALTVSGENIVLAGTGISSGGALRTSGNDVTLTGNFALVGNALVVNETAGTVLTLGGNVGREQTGTLTISGAGDVSMNGKIANQDFTLSPVTARAFNGVQQNLADADVITNDINGTTTPSSTGSFTSNLAFTTGQFNSTLFNNPPLTLVDNFTTIFETTLTVITPGVYTFAVTNNDDGAAVWLKPSGNASFVSGDRLQGIVGNSNTAVATRNLEAGTYTLVYAHREGTGNESVTGRIFGPTTTGVINGTLLPIVNSSVTTGTGVNNLVKNGTGTLFLNGANTYDGTTTINAGKVVAGSNSALGTGAVTLANTDAVLELANGATIDRPLTISDTGNNKILSLSVGATSGTYSGNIAINETGANNFDVSVGDGGTLTLSGVISGTGAAGLTKEGLGTLVLSGDNTYSGATTVNAGTLRLDFTANSGSKLADAALNLNGGVLRYTGTGTETIGSLVIGPGNANTIILGAGQVLTVTNPAVSMGTGSTLLFDLRGGGVANWDATLTTGIISSQIFVWDDTGLGVATVVGGQVVRASNLLPESGGSATINYIVDNHDGTDDGSDEMELTGNVSAAGIAVNTTDRPGTLALNGFTLITNGINLFGGNNYTISGNGGLRGINPNDTLLLINNNGAAPFVVNASILANGTGGLTVNNAADATTVLGRTGSYTGATTLAGGTVRLTADNALSSGALNLGGAAGLATVLDLVNASQQVGALTVNTHSPTASAIAISAGKIFTATGNVLIGNNAATGLSTTNFNVSGDGSFAVNNTAASGSFQVGATTSGTNGSAVTADFSGLSSMNVNLSGATSVITVNPVNGTNLTGAQSKLILAQNSVLRAATLTVGGSGQFNNGAGQINQVLLGSGSNILNFNTINIGNGARDYGAIAFLESTGTVQIRASDGTGRAAFNLATGTPTGTATVNTTGSSFDVTGHSANLLFSTMSIGTQNRGNISNSTFSFDQGILDTNSLVLATRSANPTTGTASTWVTNSTINLGGGTVNINNGISQMAAITGSLNAATAVNAAINISGGTVTVGATGGNSIVMASASAGTASADLNLTGGAVTLSGSVVRGSGAGTTSATVTLDGASLNMSGNAIGSSTASVTFNAQSGTLSNLGGLNGSGTLTKTTAGTLILNGANAFTGLTAVNEGVLLVNGTHTGGGAYSVASGATLGGNGTIGSNVTIASGATLATGSSIGSTGTLTVNGNVALHGTLVYGVDAAPGQSDKLVVNGNLDLTGATLDLSGFLGSDDSYTIATYTGTLSGSFASLTNLPSGYGLVVDASAKTLSLAKLAVVVTETGGSTIVTEGGATDSISVRLNAQPNSNLTVTLNAGPQVSLSATTLTFTPADWATPQVVTVTAVDDNLLEGVHGETIIFSNNGGAINAGNVTVQIADNDSATASLSVTTHGNETGPVHIVFTVTLDKINNTGAPITFDLTDTLTGTATSGADYAAIPSGAKISIPIGASSGSYSVSVIDDLFVEATETVIASMSNPSNPAVTIGTATATANITDNDVAPTIVYVDPSFTVAGANVDGNLEAPGLQAAQVGANAFATIGAALAALDATQPGMVIINSGVYTEAVNLTSLPQSITLRFVQGNSTVSSIVSRPTDFINLGGVGAGHTTPVMLTLGNAGNQLIASTISGTGGLTKAGTGTVTLSGTNTYSGSTHINAGTLAVTGVIGSGGPAGTVTIAAGATLSGSGTVNAPIAGSTALATITATGNLSLGDGSAAGYAFGGSLHVGSHTVTISDSNGATAGNISIAGGILTSANGITLNPGAILQGAGTVVAGQLIASSGSISPGDNSGDRTGTLTVNGNLLANGATLVLHVDGLTAGDFDQLIVNGTVNLTDATLSISGSVPTAGAITLIANDGIDPVIGTFSGLANGSNLLINGKLFQINYSGGDGNDVALAAVPVITGAVNPASPTVTSAALSVQVTFSEPVTLDAGKTATVVLLIDRAAGGFEEVVATAMGTGVAASALTFVTGALPPGLLDTNGIAIKADSLGFTPGDLSSASGIGVSALFPAITLSNLQVDTDAPAALSILRAHPSAALTNADTLEFMVTFSEDVAGVDASDFAVTGSTATVTGVAAIPGSAREFIVSVSGGDLANLNGTVGLVFATGQDIADAAGNPFGGTAPAISQTYTLDNETPAVAISGPVSPTSANPFTVTVNFGETVTGFSAGSVLVGNGAVTSVTNHGNGLFTLLITAANDGLVTVDIPDGAASDLAGNPSLAAPQFVTLVASQRLTPFFSGVFGFLASQKLFSDRTALFGITAVATEVPDRTETQWFPMVAEGSVGAVPIELNGLNLSSDAIYNIVLGWKTDQGDVLEEISMTIDGTILRDLAKHLPDIIALVFSRM